MAKASKKGAGRPAGAMNKKNEQPRNERANHFRCSEGFRQVTEILIEDGQYQSKSDVYHEAVQLLVLRKEVKGEAAKKFEHWKKRIV